jgi:hypothetical protein
MGKDRILLGKVGRVIENVVDLALMRFYDDVL